MDKSKTYILKKKKSKVKRQKTVPQAFKRNSKLDSSNFEKDCRCKKRVVYTHFPCPCGMKKSTHF